MAKERTDLNGQQRLTGRAYVGGWEEVKYRVVYPNR